MYKKQVWVAKYPGLLFALGLYVGGHLSYLRPVFQALNELDTCKRDRDDMSKQIDRLREDITRYQRQGELVSDELPQNTLLLPHNSTDSKLHPFCKAMNPLMGPSSSHLLLPLTERIVESSRLPQDAHFQLKAFTRQLWRLISPRLPNSVKSIVRRDQQWDKIDDILRKAHRRIEYFQTQTSDDSPTVPPPVKILVMGGSVTRGTNCQLNIRGTTRFDCAWPNRLETFINTFSGIKDKVVEVKVVGIGGSNSATGTAILRDELVREDAQNADILINHYSTNDMHIMTMQQAAERNTTLGDEVLEMAQDFVRQALGGSCGAAPLLLWLDDYLGNEQSEILSTMALSQSIQTLSSYYGFGFVSYADMVRDWVYGDTRETLFSPPGWYQHGEYHREIHPGAAGHMAMAWAMSYYFLELTTTYCGLQPLLRAATDSHLAGQPEPPPTSLPPRLSKSLSLEHVSDQWHGSSTLQESRSLASNQCSQKCIFSWVSGMDLEQNDPLWIRAKFRPYLVNSTGWELAEQHKKIGFVPRKNFDGHSRWRLDFNEVKQSVRYLTLFTMKSYGSKWRGSSARLTIYRRGKETVDWDPLSQHRLKGEHDKYTSEMYIDSFEIDVNESQSLRLEVESEKGTFKILGLAVCS